MKLFGSALLIGIISVVAFFYAAYADTTPFLNYAGDRGSAANFTSPLNAVGAETVVCASQGTAAKQQYYNNFGFGIPSGSTINGITLKILASTSTGSETWDFHLRKTETGSDSGLRTATVANNNACGLTQGTYTMGGSADLWNTTWTPAQVNAADFGVLISLPTVATATRRINTIVMQIDYTLNTTTLTSTVTSTTTTTISTTTTLTSTVTTTLTVTNTVNTTQTFNTTTTLTSTSTTTLTNTVNSTSTYNTTLTSTTTLTTTTTKTNTVNSTTTTTISTTTTIVDTTETCTRAVSTYYFFNGVETGNFTGWSRTASGNGGAVNVTSHNPINGTYSLYVTVGSTANGYGYAEGLPNASVGNLFGVQMFVAVNNFTHTPNKGFFFLSLRNSTAGSAGGWLRAGYYHEGASEHVLQLQLNDPNLGTQTYFSNDLMLFNNSISNIEIVMFKDPTMGYIKAYVNGSLEILVSGLDTSYLAYNLTDFRVGITETGDNRKNFDVKIDNVALGNNRVGQICYPISTISTTTTLSSTTTITAAVCSALLCANTDFYGEAAPWWIMVVLIGLMFGGALVIGQRRRRKDQPANTGEGM